MSQETRYWSFDSVLKQLFIYKGMIHLLDMQGNIFRFDNHKWERTSIKLKPKSMILDSTNGLLACYPSLHSESSRNTGTCYQVGDGWQVDINWRDIEPRVCGTYLVAIDERNSNKLFRKYSKVNGELVLSRKIDSVPEDLCAIHM